MISSHSPFILFYCVFNLFSCLFIYSSALWISAFFQKPWLLECYWEAYILLNFLLNPKIDHFQMWLLRMILPWGADYIPIPTSTPLPQASCWVSIFHSSLKEEQCILIHCLLIDRALRCPYPCWLSRCVAGDRCIRTQSHQQVIGRTQHQVYLVALLGASLPCRAWHPSGWVAPMWMREGRTVVTEGTAAGVSAPTPCV